jgi:PPM family protein phosphatase
VLTDTLRPTTGSASDRGRRRHAADALAVQRGPDGLGVTFADGIGDSAGAAAAARIAADTAAAMAAHDGAVAALMAAGAALRLRGGDGDAVMVVAAVRPGRCEIAWVGDCRAYLSDGTRIRLLTTDQTAAQAVRDAGGTPPRGWENVVTGTVARATVKALGHREVPGVGRLALLTDGVHHELSGGEIAERLDRAPDCAAAARALTDAALLGGAGDNASATVIDLPIGAAAHRPLGSTNPSLPAVPRPQAADSAHSVSRGSCNHALSVP